MGLTCEEEEERRGRGGRKSERGREGRDGGGRKSEGGREGEGGSKYKLLCTPAYNTKSHSQTEEWNESTHKIVCHPPLPTVVCV